MNERHYISGLMAAKKTPHAPEIGLNPVDYGMEAENGIISIFTERLSITAIVFFKRLSTSFKGYLFRPSNPLT